MHEHNECDHDLKYCAKCDVVYCAKCKREWSGHQHSIAWYGYSPQYQSLPHENKITCGDTDATAALEAAWVDASEYKDNFLRVSDTSGTAIFSFG